MIRFFLVTSLCFFSGCAFLDDDLLLDDEEFEESFSSSYGISSSYGSGGSWSCGARIHAGRVSMGRPGVRNHGGMGIREFDFDPDDIDGQRVSAPIHDGISDEYGLEEQEVDDVFEDWHAEFLRAEEGWLLAEEALAQKGDKALSN